MRSHSEVSFFLTSGVDSSRYTGSFIDIPLVTRRFYWEVTLSKVSSGSTILLGQNINVIMDTGTTMVLIYHSYVDLTTSYTC